MWHLNILPQAVLGIALQSLTGGASSAGTVSSWHCAGQARSFCGHSCASCPSSVQACKGCTMLSPLNGWCVLWSGIGSCTNHPTDKAWAGGATSCCKPGRHRASAQHRAHPSPHGLVPSAMWHAQGWQHPAAGLAGPERAHHAEPSAGSAAGSAGSAGRGSGGAGHHQCQGLPAGHGLAGVLAKPADTVMHDGLLSGRMVGSWRPSHRLGACTDRHRLGWLPRCAARSCAVRLQDVGTSAQQRRDSTNLEKGHVRSEARITSCDTPPVPLLAAPPTALGM